MRSYRGLGDTGSEPHFLFAFIYFNFVVFGENNCFMDKLLAVIVLLNSRVCLVIVDLELVDFFYFFTLYLIQLLVVTGLFDTFAL